MDSKCEKCGRALIAFRKLSKQDWRGRKYHTTCWKKIEEEKELQAFLLRYQRQ
jgi:hypothetical protein